ncbi:tyrosine-type recombinase/integrase [Candidatus Omnitrophota bacterium]
MSKRYPGVRHIKDNSYEINYYPHPNADRVWNTVEADSMKSASLLRADKIKNYKTEEPSLDFDKLKVRLEHKLIRDGLSKKSIYSNLIPKFNSFFEKFLPGRFPDIKDINRINREVIEQYKDYIVRDCNRPKGWRDELTKLKVIFSKLIKDGCCNRSIYDEVLKEFKRPKRTNKLYREISKSDMKQLLDYVKKDRLDYYGITYMIMRLGWRRGQVISIKRQNVRLDGLRPAEILIEPEDTKNKESVVFRDIDAELANILKQYKFSRKKSIWLFPNTRGGKHHPNHYTEYIRKTSQEVLGVTIGPHYFRHSFITRMLREGHSPRDIMAITGHKDMDSFNIYAHSTSEGTRKVVAESKLWD